MVNLMAFCRYCSRYVLLFVVSMAITAAHACVEPIAKIASTKGDVKINDSQALVDTTICQSDTVFVGALSRAVIVLLNSDTVVSIDQNTTLTLIDDSEQNGTLLDLFEGALNLISPALRALDIRTPFVNAAVEGTEFLIQVESDRTLISVFEGLVVASNNVGSLNLSGGQSAETLAGVVPQRRTIARPRDAVQWALYYPPVGVDEKTPQLTREAGDLLTVGRVDEATRLLKQVRNENPDDAVSVALLAIIALTQSRHEEAARLAENAVAIDPESGAAYTALSYVQQSQFDIDGALESAEQAVHNDPNNGYALARLAELQLSKGELKASLESAQLAVSINPTVSRTQTVLGFAHLIRIETEKARETFYRAIALNSADPLARLGLGLAKIRDGDLKEGRQDIEIAAALDPNNSLIRSYLGKAYFEEKRDGLDSRQYSIAKELDPNDPTPWYYDAIRKQTINRPVDALQDLQKSIELNDNRAVYRSRLLIDNDLAGRSASLAKIYSDLGFEQLALLQGWRSVNTDFGNSSGHRLLADSYASLGNRQIAQVSELLLSQLRQPLLQNPATTKLNGSNLPNQNSDNRSVSSEFFSNSLDPSFNEYSSLFTQNGINLALSAYIAENNTIEEEVILSSVSGNYSGSLNQFFYKTDGISERQELEQDQNIGTFFFQHAVSPVFNWQFEGRLSKSEYNYFNQVSLELPPGIPPELIPDIPRLDFIEHYKSNFFRLGGRIRFSADTDMIANFTRAKSDLDQNRLSEEDQENDVLDIDSDGVQVELQHLTRSDTTQFITGLGFFQNDRSFLNTIQPGEVAEISSDDEHINFYSYGVTDFTDNFSATLGLSVDKVASPLIDDTQINPKLGIIWKPTPVTTLRAAAFRSIKRGLLLQRTIEPTSVAGFNQFFDDSEGTDAYRYGIGIDQQFSQYLYGGIESSWSKLSSPILSLIDDTPVSSRQRQEILSRSYLYWAPTSKIAISTEFQYERIRNASTSHRSEFGINYFHPKGFRLVLSPAYVDQSFSDSERSDENFWTTNVDFIFKVPKRRVSIALGIRNAFKQRVNLQDTGLSNIDSFPDRFVFGNIYFTF